MIRPGLLALGLFAVPTVPAQDGTKTGGEDLAVYLVTFGPGPRVYERFGHNGLWFRDTVTGEGPIYDYGRFSFAEPGFLLKFALGDMQYWMGKDEGSPLIDRYVQAGRSVWLQELELAPHARVRLLDSLEANLAREQGRYRYDYYLDNCSTRIRDAIDMVTGGAVRSRLAAHRSGTTYRVHSRRSLEYNIPLYGVVMAALGAPTDRPISNWEDAFLPLELQRYIRGVTVPDAGGDAVPLVKRETAVVESDLFTVPQEPGRHPLVVLVVLGGVLGVGVAGLGYLGRTARWGRGGYLLLAGAWELAATVAALLILWFWVLSDHRAAHQNANVFQFNLMAPVVLVALSRLAGGGAGAVRWVRRLAGVTALVALLGPVVEWVSGWEQQNAEVVGFALPLHLGVLVGALALGRATTPLSPSEGPPAPR